MVGIFMSIRPRHEYWTADTFRAVDFTWDQAATGYFITLRSRDFEKMLKLMVTKVWEKVR